MDCIKRIGVDVHDRELLVDVLCPHTATILALRRVPMIRFGVGALLDFQYLADAADWLQVPSTATGDGKTP